MGKFSGFGPSTIHFLTTLAENNNRTWFNEHKQDYEACVLEPALDFIADMAPVIHGVSPHFDVIPKRQGGSLMRIYRDTRFGKDKTPYKTNIGIQFRHAAGKDVHAPGFYLHIDPDELFFGVGMWRPDGPTVARVRAAIDESQDAWRKVSRNKPFASPFEFQGDSLKRPPKGFAADHPLLDDLKRKDFIAVATLDVFDVAKPTLPAAIGKLIKPATAYMSFLCKAVEVPF